MPAKRFSFNIFRKTSPLTALILVLITSGCIIPGLPNLFRPQVVEYTDDIVIIKDLKAIPSKVSPGQQTKIVAYIQNIGKEKLPLENAGNVEIELYDHCEGLFPKEDIRMECPGTKITKTKCRIDELLPNQIKEINWVLRPKPDIKLKTICPLDGMKVAIKYGYKTTSLSTISFINYQFMQTQLEQGTFKTKESYIVAGEGPVKPFITVKDQQPIPIEEGVPSSTVIALKIENKGHGFLENSEINSGIENIKIDLSGLKTKSNNCNFEKSGEFYTVTDTVKLIQKKSADLLCEIDTPYDENLPKETVKHVTVDIKYNYEFRKTVKVTVELL